MRSALAFAAATALVAAPLAAGHAPVQVGGYVSTVSEVKPNVLGLQVAILGGADRIRLANLSGKTIVVLDASGRPLLRFEATAVFRTDPGAQPRWRKVASGSSYAWRDPRVRWEKGSAPPAVGAVPDEPHLIRKWAIPGTAAGIPFEIRGFLGYAPPPAAPEDSAKLRALVVTIGVVVLAAAAGVLFYVPRRRTSSSRRSA
jgi:hypothetical protein